MEASRIFKASRKGRVYLLKCILESKTEEEIIVLVSSIKKGLTPFLLACKKGHYPVAQYLLNKCDKIDILAPQWLPTPLSLAVRGDNLDLVRMLITHNVVAAYEDIPELLFNAMKSESPIAEYLIDSGTVDARVENDSGYTGLMEACKTENTDFARFLLTHKVDPNKKDKDGNTALHWYLLEKSEFEDVNEDIVNLLAVHRAEIIPNYEGTTALQFSARDGDKRAVKCILDNFDQVDISQRVDALKLLGASQAYVGDLEGAYSSWQSALRPPYEETNAETNNAVAALSHLLDEKEFTNNAQLSELQGTDRMRKHALLIMARLYAHTNEDCADVISEYIEEQEHIEEGNLIISLWACAFSTVSWENTPIAPSPFDDMFNIMLNRFNAYLLRVIENKSDLSEDLYKNIFGILDIVIKEIENFGGFTRVYFKSVLEFICVMLKFDLNENIKRDLKSTFKPLLNVALGLENDQTLLHLVCTLNSGMLFDSKLKMVEFLLEVGASPNAPDGDGNTPFHVAAQQRPFDDKVFKLMLKLGGHLDFRNSENKTPLELVDYEILNLDPFPY